MLSLNKKILIILIFAVSCFAGENYINMKNCETIKLSQYTTLVACHKIDYLIEYRQVEDEEKDTIKKITAITQKDQKIIKSLGK